MSLEMTYDDDVARAGKDTTWYCYFVFVHFRKLTDLESSKALAEK